MNPFINFSEALDWCKRGKKIQREGWNGKGMWVVLVQPSETPISGFCFYINGHDPLPTLPFLAMKTVDDKMVPWLASQTDILAEDWQYIV